MKTVAYVVVMVALAIALVLAFGYGMANDPNINGRVYQELRQDH